MKWKSLTNVERLTLDVEPDLVCIQVYLTNAYRAFSIANSIADSYRQRDTNVAMGDLHVTSLPNEAALHVDTTFRCFSIYAQVLFYIRSSAFLYTFRCFSIYVQVLVYIRSSAFLYTLKCFSIYVQVLFYIRSSVFLYIFNDFHIILSVLFAVVACRGEGTLAYLLTGIPHDECVGCCGVGRLMLFAHRECSGRRVDEIVGHLFV